MAAAWNRVESLKVLIDNGADYDLKTRYNEVAKDIAERYGNHSCTTYLDSAGVHATFPISQRRQSKFIFGGER